MWHPRRVVDFEKWNSEFEDHKNRLKDPWIVLQDGTICCIKYLAYVTPSTVSRGFTPRNTGQWDKSRWRYAVQCFSEVSSSILKSQSVIGSKKLKSFFDLFPVKLVSPDKCKHLTPANIQQVKNVFSNFHGFKIRGKTPDGNKFEDQPGEVDDFHEERGKIWISLKWLKRDGVDGSKTDVPLANVDVSSNGKFLIVRPGASDEVASNKSATGDGDQTRKPGA